MKIYTRTGDSGATGLFGGGRVDKDNDAVEAYGSVDELNACLGVARAALGSGETERLLGSIQSDLLTLGAELGCALAVKDALERAERRAGSGDDDDGIGGHAAGWGKSRAGTTHGVARAVGTGCI